MYGRTALRSSIYNMAIRHTQAKLPLQTRQSSSTLPNTLYQNVWRKSNVFYILYVVAGCIILEGVYGSVTTSIWDAVNKGKLYKQIDWSKFKSADDEEEEE